MKQAIEEVVLDRSWDEILPRPDDWPPETIWVFERWLADLMRTIPAGYHSGAKITFTGGTQDGDVYVRIVVSYPRPETDAEEQRREAREREQERWHQERAERQSRLPIDNFLKRCSDMEKRALWDMLKKEYGETP